MGDDKSSIVMASRDRDRELLIPVADSVDHDDSSKPSSSASSSHHTGREVFTLCLASLFFVFRFYFYVFLMCKRCLYVFTLFFVGFGLASVLRSTSLLCLTFFVD